MGTNCTIRFKKHPHIVLYKSKNSWPFEIEPMIRTAIKDNTVEVMGKDIIQTTLVVVHLIAWNDSKEWKLWPEDHGNYVEFEYMVHEDGTIESEAIDYKKWEREQNEIEK